MGAVISEADQELKILRQFGITHSLSYFFGEESDTDGGTHWFLLLHEATKMGIVASDAEINAAFSALLASGVTNEQFEAQLKSKRVYRALPICGTASPTGFRRPAGWTLAAGGLWCRCRKSSISPTKNSQQRSCAQYAIIDGKGTRDGRMPRSRRKSKSKQFDLYKDVVATLPDATCAAFW